MAAVKNKKGTTKLYTTVRIKSVTAKRIRDNKKKTGVPSVAFIEALVNKELGFSK